MAGVDLAKRSVRGSLILFVGYTSSSLLLAVAIFLIARLLGPAGYGTYSLSLVIPSVLQLFVGFGVNNAVIRFSAYSISIGRPGEARRYTRNAIYFIWLTGAIFSALNYLLADLLSNALLQRPALAPYVQLMSLAIVGQALFLTITFTALGWNWMALSSTFQVMQAAVKTVLGPLLILLGFGVAGALTGHAFGLITAGIVGTAVLKLTKLRGPVERGSFFGDVGKMLGFGIPVYAGTLASSLATYYAAIVLANISSNTVFGLFQSALNFLAPVALVTTSLVYALFPAFASLDGIGGNAKVAFKQAYKFVAFLVTPIVVFLAAAPSVLVRTFYGASFSGSAPYLHLLALAYLPIAFGYTIHPAFFNGFNRPRLTFLVYFGAAVTLAIGAPSLAVWEGFGVDGIIYATFLSYFVAWVVGTYMADRFMGARLDLRATGAILLASAASYLATRAFSGLFAFSLSAVIELLLDLLVFGGVYLSLAPLAGAVNGGDLDVMEHTFKDLKGVNRLFGLFLRYERAILSLRN